MPQAEFQLQILLSQKPQSNFLHHWDLMGILVKIINFRKNSLTPVVSIYCFNYLPQKIMILN